MELIISSRKKLLDKYGSGNFLMIEKAYKVKHEFGIRAFTNLIILSLLNNPINLFRRKYVRILLRAIVGDYRIDGTK